MLLWPRTALPPPHQRRHKCKRKQRLSSVRRRWSSANCGLCVSANSANSVTSGQSDKSGQSVRTCRSTRTPRPGSSSSSAVGSVRVRPICSSSSSRPRSRRGLKIQNAHRLPLMGKLPFGMTRITSKGGQRSTGAVQVHTRISERKRIKVSSILLSLLPRLLLLLQRLPQHLPLVTGLNPPLLDQRPGPPLYRAILLLSNNPLRTHLLRSTGRKTGRRTPV